MPTFAAATEKVIRLHSAKWKPGGRTEEHWRASLRTYAYPVLARKRLNEIAGADIMRCLKPIWHTKPETARVVLRRIGAVMKWAVAQGYRPDNPADGRITAGLGTNRNGGPRHFEALPHAEVADALRRVAASKGHWATRSALRFLTLTATRSGETRGACWTEIDGDTWTIPADRTKTGKAFRVPLSAEALTILEHAREQTRGRGLVFPSRSGRQQPGVNLASLLRRVGIDAVPHGMRSSFRDFSAENGIDRQLAEMSLAHTVKGVEAAYMRSDRLEERRAVLEAWAAYVT